MFLKLFLLVCVHFCFSKSVDITFKNVTIKGYRMYVEKYKRTIESSNKLQDFLPEVVIDKIEIVNQNVPVLYEKSLANLEDLDELAIEYSEVYEIRPGALKNVPMLRKLSLKGNKLEEIKVGVFNNLEISSIDLSQNTIVTIESGAFNNMPNLLNIYIADNEISIWNNEWFKNTPLLARISMQNNSLEELPERAFKNLIGSKKFGSVDLTLNLIFSHNKVKKIHPRAFKGLDKLNNLWLDYNNLKDFDGNLLEGIDVTDLRIDNNEIECVEGDYEKIFKAESTHIDGNPFDCDCLNRIKEWTEKNKKTVHLFYAAMECMTQRIRSKMDAVEQRLKEIREKTKTEDDAELIETFE